MMAMFIGTLQSPFYDHMIGNMSSNFADIVVIGERVEVGLKSGKITQFDGKLTCEENRV